MSRDEQDVYYHHLDDAVVLKDNIQTASEGRLGNRAEGRAKGRSEGERAKQIEIARNLIIMGLESEAVAKATGLDVSDIDDLIG